MNRKPTPTYVVRLFVLAAIALASSGSAAPQQEPKPAPPATAATLKLKDLAWMAGAWVKEDDASRSEEHWMPPRGGSMIGMNRMVMRAAAEPGGEPQERMLFFEFLRIDQTAQGVVYLASPNGRVPPTPFLLIELGKDRALFENPKNDFPTRITYERKGDELHARIEGTQNGEPASQTWTWKRQRD